jgi:hypothetical protein
LKKVLTLAITMCALFGLTAFAIAQNPAPVVTMEGTTTPTKGGTKKKPKNGSVSVAFTVNKESRVTADRIEFYTPEHVKLSGAGFRFCPRSQIQSNGASSCPSGSKIGEGTASAVLGPNQAPLEFDIDVYWGSKNSLTINLQQRGGSLVVPLEAPLTSAGKPFGQKATVDIPSNVQQPATGVYSQITGVQFKIGPKTAKKKVTVRKGGKKRRVTRTYRAVSVIGCPTDRTHDYQVRLRYVPNPTPPAQGTSTQGDTSACSK